MMKNRQLFIIGQIALVIGFIGFWANYFYFENLTIYFMVGILLGLSIIFNLSYMLKYRK